ncbi:MAG TPA: sensor domain-containing diguanylate cyclase, partial [Nitrospiria bacterium]|nr:sensor domain-containing diguanylate cyclase [Nitrospiria bacterium]
LFRSILDKSTEFLQAEQGSLMVLEEENNVLSIRAIKGLNKTLVEMLRIHPGEGISGRVYESGLPMLVQDITSDQRVSQPPRSRYKTGSFISAPLKLHNRTIGVINVADKTTGSPFSDGDLELLTAIGSYASVAIERSSYYQKTEELRKISITDHLTGLLNRRYFQERLIEEVERSRRHRLPVSLMIIDVDDFKKINDSLGHPAGDEILKILTHSIRSYIRAIDVAARYGGEEFTIILPQTTKQDAAVIAERICKGIERNEAFQERFKGWGLLTVSIGLAAYPDDASNIEEMVRHADEALYSAKSRGKNKVVLYDSKD